MHSEDKPVTQTMRPRSKPNTPKITRNKSSTKLPAIANIQKLGGLQKPFSKSDIPISFYRAIYAVAMMSLPLKLTNNPSQQKASSSPKASRTKNLAAMSVHITKQQNHDGKREKEAIEAWEITPELLDEAYGFYEDIYGENLISLPEEVENSPEYQNQDPIEVAKAYDDLGMTHEDTPLCWVARLYLSMPLPPEYYKIEDSTGVYYMHKVRLVKLPVHPALTYLKGILRRTQNSLTSGETLEVTPQRQQVFIDQFRRTVKVDMLLMRLTVEGNTRKYDFYSNKMVSDFDQTSNLKGAVLDNHENSEPIVSKTKITDLMIFDVCRQAGVDRLSSPHLVGFVASFMLEKEAIVKDWECRNPNPQKYFWVNTVVKKAQTEYPFLEELTAKLVLHQEKLADLTQRTDNFRDLVKLSFAFKKMEHSDIKKSVMKERFEIMQRVVIKRTQNVKAVKALKKADQINAKMMLIPGDTLDGLKPSDNPNDSESFMKLAQLAGEGDLNASESATIKKLEINRRNSKRFNTNLASQLLLRKGQERKVHNDDTQENQTRQLVKDLYSLLGEDIIVVGCNEG